MHPSPFGTSVQVLATYYRYTPAISYNRLARLFEELYGLHISKGGLANLFQQVKQTLELRVAEIGSRLRSRRLVCSDETSGRVNGDNQWEWVFQNQEVCLHVIRPSRGQKVIDEVRDGHKPEIGVSDLFSARMSGLMNECLLKKLVNALKPSRLNTIGRTNKYWYKNKLLWKR